MWVFFYNLIRVSCYKLIMKKILNFSLDERLEDFILTKLDQKTNKQNIIEQLGQSMVEAGHDFGPSTQYGWIKFTHYSFFLYDFFCLILGSTLIKCGQTHQKLGHTYKDFIQSVVMGYMQPLKSFLEGEMKSITVNILTFFWSIIKKNSF